MSVASTKAFTSAVLNPQDPAAKQCSRFLDPFHRHSAEPMSRVKLSDPC